MIRRRTTLFAAAGWLAAGTARADDAAPVPKPGKRDWAAQVPVIRIGLLGGENDADRLGRYGPYGKLLEDTFEVSTRMFSAADYAGVIQAFAAKQLEICYMSPAAYAGAWLESDGDVKPLLTAKEADGSISYKAAMLVRADSDIKDLAGMKGRSLAWADPNSASGYLIPRSELRKQGIDPEPGKYFSRTGFGGGHEQAMVAVLQKQYDASVTWVSGVGDPAQGYTRGAMHEMVAKGMMKPGELRPIWLSDPILNGPLTVRKSTPQSFRDDMLAFHLALATWQPAIFQQIQLGTASGFARVKHEDYQPFIDLRREEAANRRKRS